MSAATINKSEIVKSHARKPNDTGSPEDQVAILTARINDLTPHFKTHLKDRDADRYTALIQKLGLRK